VLTTIKPIHSIAAAVLGETGTAELLIDGAASPHSYALKPSDARLLDSTDVFVRVSEQVEPFTSRIVRALPDGVEVVTLAETDGLRLLPVRFGEHFDAHEHVEGEHAHADHGAELNAGTADGHVWLDPENAKLMARRLAKVFAGRWPQKGQAFKANAERFAAEVDAAAAEITSELAPVRDVPFVVFHDAYHYFEDRFGLKTAGAVTINPEVPPGARRLAALRHRIEDLGGVCVFAEPQFNPKVLDAVAAGTGARSGVLDPIGSDIAPGPGLYTAMLRKLADGFASCLGHEPARAGAAR
jgi:zinc transport system substrate-binding protein